MNELETRYAERFARNDEHNLDIELRAVTHGDLRAEEYARRTALAAAHRAEAVRQTAAAQKLRGTRQSDDVSHYEFMLPLSDSLKARSHPYTHIADVLDLLMESKRQGLNGEAWAVLKNGERVPVTMEQARLQYPPEGEDAW